MLQPCLMPVATWKSAQMLIVFVSLSANSIEQYNSIVKYTVTNDALLDTNLLDKMVANKTLCRRL